MLFNYTKVNYLPPLAWCAQLQQGSDVKILHGSRIERLVNGFVEGAWSGDFGSVDFDECDTLTGSGGKLVNGKAIFCGASHNLEQLYLMRKSEAIILSNSLPFLLACADDSLNMDYQDYFFTFLNNYRRGIFSRSDVIPTAQGHVVEPLSCSIVEAKNTLEVTVRLRDFGTAPECYPDYIDRLDRVVSRTLANAQDARRQYPLSLRTMISRGYDSPAVSLLAARHGCNSGISFSHSSIVDLNPGQSEERDDGIEIGAYLGLDIELLDRKLPTQISESVIAEHFPNPFLTTELNVANVTEGLDSCLLMSGRHGEHFWNLDRRRSLPWFQEPTTVRMSGANSTEARLRQGYIHFPVPYIAGVFTPHIRQISRSREMRPWSVGGNYDRPIPRRLLEEAGVPRRTFGMRKMGGGLRPGSGSIFSPIVMTSFEDFYANNVAQEIHDNLPESNRKKVALAYSMNMPEWEKTLRTLPLVGRSAVRFLGDGRHSRYRSPYLYFFHWGVSVVMERYRLALANVGMSAAECLNNSSRAKANER
ncbi:MAG: hypothetical protein DHS20C01_01360 [marine bacterium B5-7]|nr:MAG: hypothetical protein DHS20C01_01360 [marine bacterium B5-7]